MPCTNNHLSSTGYSKRRNTVCTIRLVTLCIYAAATALLWDWCACESICKEHNGPACSLGFIMHRQLRSLPVRVRSREKPSRFQSLMVLSEEVVASWRTSGLSRHFKM